MKLKKTIFAIFFSFLSLASFAQDIGSEDEESKSERDIVFDSSSFVETKNEKHRLVALGGVVAVNGLIHIWDRFVVQNDWAQVYWDDINRPWKRTIKFDEDWYWTNFVLHPYQGSLYYLGARNSGLNPLESFFVAAAGSITWEYICETNEPSVNDLVYTPVGGFVVGEMLYRLGLEAQGRKKTFWSFVANPMRIYTDPLLRHSPPGPTGLLQSFSIKTGFGTSLANTWLSSNYSDCFELFPVFASAGIEAVYDDPYGHDSNTPYSQFDLSITGSVGVGSGEGNNTTQQNLMYNIGILSSGMIFARSPDFGENRDTTIGMVLEYDFMWHSFMEFSSLAPGIAIKQRINKSNGAIEWQSHLAPILMGTADYYYLHRSLVPGMEDVSCDYGYTSGAEVIEKWAYKHNSGLVFDCTVHGYAMYKYKTLKGDSYDTGWEFFALAQLSLELPLSHFANLGISDDFYAKYAAYHSYDNLVSIYNSVCFYARFNLL